MEDRYRWERQIVQLCPLNVQVSAVLYDEINDTIIRIPQVALALCDEVRVDLKMGRDTTERQHGLVAYVDGEFTALGPFADEQGNFLGYEVGGEERNWTSSVESYKRENAAGKTGSR